MPIDKKVLLDALQNHLTPERIAGINRVLHQRTRKLCLVLEDIRKEHNTGALLRTADILGIQDVHLISQHYEPKLAEAIAKGSANWVSLYRYQAREADNLQECLDHLKSQDYQLIVADPDGEVALEDLSYQGKPMALLMGSEWEGVSAQAKEAADLSVRIPQYGFTQSFNVSVAAALILQKLGASLRKSGDWSLSQEEVLDLALDWTMQKLGDRAWKIREKIENDLLNR